MIVFAIYSYLSIRGKTASITWHLFQWISVLNFLLIGFGFGRWWQEYFNFHDFGEIIGVAIIGIPVYVFFLHWLLKRK